MEKVISTENKQIKMWLNKIDDGALKQAKNLANLPFIFKHVAIMPDCHQGYGMPIGGVIATRHVIVPNAVGVDIGCGICAVKTNIQEVDYKKIKQIMVGIRSKIPVGFNHHPKKQTDWLSDADKGILWGWSVIEKEYKSSLKQIGTLGGGNHFIEIQKGSDGYIWLMIHSGSRNIGYKVAKHYNKVAVNLNAKLASAIPKKWELAFLPLNNKQGLHYLEEMQSCVNFAYANRKLMMKRVKEAVSEFYVNVKYGEMINIAHNYAVLEHHFGQDVMVHRKGATRAYKNQTGIIPGSQGTSSYIVQGLGNPESFKSCSHGAGRKMGRKQAKKQLNFNAEKKRLEDAGVIHSLRSEKELDEAVGAYKDISVVMENQSDLVKTDIELKPLCVIKG